MRISDWSSDVCSSDLLDERRVLAILVFTDGEIQNRAVEMPRPLSASELEWIANYLNQNYAGLGLAEIRERLVGELDGERREVDRRMAATVALADRKSTRLKSSH